MRTYTIELRADFKDEQKFDILLEVVREAARTMISTAQLLKDSRDPSISLETGDMFMREKDLSILDDTPLPRGE